MRTPRESAIALAERVAATRLALNLSQQEVSSRAVIPLPTYKTFERTGRLPIDRLAAVLNVLGRQHELDGILSKLPADFEAIWSAKEPKTRKRASRKGRTK